jgi:hypothetical protein
MVRKYNPELFVRKEQDDRYEHLRIELEGLYNCGRFASCRLSRERPEEGKVDVSMGRLPASLRNAERPMCLSNSRCPSARTRFPVQLPCTSNSQIHPPNT